jgi:hypothetical protein
VEINIASLGEPFLLCGDLKDQGKANFWFSG